MHPDDYQTLIHEADALDENARLLRLFDLEPVLTAEADSPQKHRALAYIYEALGRYQTAFQHQQTAFDRNNRHDRQNIVRLKNLAGDYGDRFAAKRPLRITAELKAALPQFKYCPDPLAANIFKTQEEAVTCDCCDKPTHIFYSHPPKVSDKARRRRQYAVVRRGDATPYEAFGGWLYTNPFYSRANINALCPGCIKSGRAAEKYHGAFVDSGSISPDIAREKQDELCHRTPSYAGWQQEPWPDHCGDYCAFIGYTGWRELEEQGLTDRIEWYGFHQPDPEYLPYIEAHGSMAGYLFRCLHCGQHVLYVDMD